MADDASADLTGRRLGNYRIDGVLGRGGMSVMYKATDVRLGRKVALKVIGEHLGADAEFRERFVDEARNTSAIDHPNIVPLYDFGELDDMLYIAMRLVDGSDLASLVGGSAMEPHRAVGLLDQVADALDTLHERGLVHLDVKPANVLVTSKESTREHVYIADFGLTRRGSTGHRTRGGDFLGSPTYAAPEHLRGEPLDGRTDQYALACMLYACLTGQPPFMGDVQTVIKGHLAGEVPSIAGAVPVVPPAIDDVVRTGMAKSASQRFPSCVELTTAARTALDQGGGAPGGTAAGPGSAQSMAVSAQGSGAMGPSQSSSGEQRPEYAAPPQGAQPGGTAQQAAQPDTPADPSAGSPGVSDMPSGVAQPDSQNTPSGHGPASAGGQASVPQHPGPGAPQPGPAPWDGSAPGQPGQEPQGPGAPSGQAPPGSPPGQPPQGSQGSPPGQPPQGLPTGQPPQGSPPGQPSGQPPQGSPGHPPPGEPPQGAPSPYSPQGFAAQGGPVPGRPGQPPQGYAPMGQSPHGPPPGQPPGQPPYGAPPGQSPYGPPPGHGPPPSGNGRSSAKGGRSWILWVLAAVIVVGAAVVTLVSLLGEGDGSENPSSNPSQNSPAPKIPIDPGGDSTAAPGGASSNELPPESIPVVPGS